MVSIHRSTVPNNQEICARCFLPSFIHDKFHLNRHFSTDAYSAQWCGLFFSYRKKTQRSLFEHLLWSHEIIMMIYIFFWSDKDLLTFPIKFYLQKCDMFPFIIGMNFLTQLYSLKDKDRTFFDLLANFSTNFGLFAK